MLKITSGNTKLNLLLNNTNKALTQVLLDATKDDLKDISKGSHTLQSIMDKVLKQTKDGSSSANKAMLELVKNNPTLTNLGNASKTIKELIKTIKSDKNPLPLEKVLKDVLVDIKDIKKIDIKQKLANSGVFLESKLKDVKNPQVELKTQLTNLKKTLQHSNTASSTPAPIKEIIKAIDVVLKNPVINSASQEDLLKQPKPNNKPLVQVAKDLNKVVEKLDKAIKSVDIVHTPKTKEIVKKLELAVSSTQIKLIKSNTGNTVSLEINSKDLDLNDIKKNDVKTNFVQEATKPKTLASSITAKEKAQIPLALQTMQDAKSIQVQQKINPQVFKEVQTQTFTDTELKLPIIKESLQALQSVLDKSLTLESKQLLKVVNTILNNLNITKEVSKELKQEIVKFVTDLKEVVQKPDVLSSKDIITIFSKLKHLTSAQALNQQSNVKELLSNDLKSVLLQTSEELQNSSHPNKTDLIKQVDKLMLQIDHYQLLSHLSNGTTVYLPVSWDQLEGGNLEIKKDNDRFHCDIELNLKDYGEVSLKLTLFEKNQINIHLYSPNKELKELFQEHLSILRAGMISAQIIPREIRFHDGLEKSSLVSEPYQGADDEFNIGFEVKG